MGLLYLIYLSIYLFIFLFNKKGEDNISLQKTLLKKIIAVAIIVAATMIEDDCGLQSLLLL